MEKQLYYIENVGCDTVTYGIAELTKEEFDVLISFIKDLNNNSYYGCMPTIDVYEASWSDFVEVPKERLNRKRFEVEYVDFEDRLYLKDKVYTWRNGYIDRDNLIPVIKGG